MSDYDMETTIQLPDEEDVDVLIDFVVTSWGSPGRGPSWSSPGDPPEPAEFEILQINRLDNNLDITDEAKELSKEYWDKIVDLVFQRVCEIDEDRTYGPDD
jgi:hypothetical protein